MFRSYKFPLRPTAHQRAALEVCLEDHRQIYNAALEERREAWNKCHVKIGYCRQAAQLPEIRKADPDGQGRWSAGSQQQTLRRLDRSFADFYRRIRTGVKPGYPRFQGSGRFKSVTWPAEKNGARWDSVPHPTVTRVYLLGIGNVRVHQHRAVKGRVKTLTVKRECGRWYVDLCCDNVPAEPLESTGAIVGIDMGLVSFLTTSDGDHVPNPRYRADSAERLASAQRPFGRKKRGSNRRLRAKAKVVRLHQKMRRQRVDHAHKVALALVRDHDVIVHEDLKVMNMSRRPKPRPGGDGAYEPNGATAKAGLNGSIQDVAWAAFFDILRDKAEWAGRAVVKVAPAYTSQRCARCGHVAAGNRPSQAEFRCLSCGHETHADVNAAINVLRAGLVLQAADAAR